MRILPQKEKEPVSLSVVDGKNGETTSNAGCLLSPVVEKTSIYYAVSNCGVNGKLSTLSKVRFKIERSKTTINFAYESGTSGDTLEKIK